jgi:hypothetical protein
MDYLPPDLLNPSLLTEERRENACDRLMQGRFHFVDIQFCAEDLFNYSPLKILVSGTSGSNISASSIQTSTTTSSTRTNGFSGTTTTTSGVIPVGSATTTTLPMQVVN